MLLLGQAKPDYMAGMKVVIEQLGAATSAGRAIEHEALNR